MASGADHPYAKLVDRDVNNKLSARDAKLANIIERIPSVYNTEHNQQDATFTYPSGITLPHPSSNLRTFHCAPAWGVTGTTRQKGNEFLREQQEKLTHSVISSVDTEKDEECAGQLVDLLRELPVVLDKYPYAWGTTTFENQAHAMIKQNFNARTALAGVVHRHRSEFFDFEGNIGIEGRSIVGPQVAMNRIVALFPNLGSIPPKPNQAASFFTVFLSADPNPGKIAHAIKDHLVFPQGANEDLHWGGFFHMMNHLTPFGALHERQVFDRVATGLAKVLIPANVVESFPDKYLRPAHAVVFGEVVSIRNECLFECTRRHTAWLSGLSVSKKKAKETAKETAKYLAKVLQHSPLEHDDYPLVMLAHTHVENEKSVTEKKALNDMIDGHANLFGNIDYRPPDGALHDPLLHGAKAAKRRVDLLCPPVCGFRDTEMTETLRNAFWRGDGAAAIKALEFGSVVTSAELETMNTQAKFNNAVWYALFFRQYRCLLGNTSYDALLDVIGPKFDVTFIALKEHISEYLSKRDTAQVGDNPYVDLVSSNLKNTIVKRDLEFTDIIKSIPGGVYKLQYSSPESTVQRIAGRPTTLPSGDFPFQYCTPAWGVTGTTRKQGNDQLLTLQGPTHSVVSPEDKEEIEEKDKKCADHLAKVLRKFPSKHDKYPHAWNNTTFEHQARAMIYLNFSARMTLAALVHRHRSKFFDFEGTIGIEGRTIVGPQVAMNRIVALFPNLGSIPPKPNQAASFFTVFLSADPDPGKIAHAIKDHLVFPQGANEDLHWGGFFHMMNHLTPFGALHERQVFDRVATGLAKVLIPANVVESFPDKYLRPAHAVVRGEMVSIRNECLLDCIERYSASHSDPSSSRETATETANYLARVLQRSPADFDDYPLALISFRSSQTVGDRNQKQVLEDMISEHADIFREIVYEPPEGAFHDPKLEGSAAAKRRIDLLCPLNLVLHDEQKWEDFRIAVFNGNGAQAFKAVSTSSISTTSPVNTWSTDVKLAHVVFLALAFRNFRCLLKGTMYNNILQVISKQFDVDVDVLKKNILEELTKTVTAASTSQETVQRAQRQLCKACDQRMIPLKGHPAGRQWLCSNTECTERQCPHPACRPKGPKNKRRTDPTALKDDGTCPNAAAKHDASSGAN